MKRLSLSNVWLAVTALVVTVGLLAVYRTSLPPEVPLWYSLPWGQDQLAASNWLWLIPGLIAAVALAAHGGGKALERDHLLASMWISAAMVAQIILVLALVRIVWLVVF